MITLNFKLATSESAARFCLALQMTITTKNLHATNAKASAPLSRPHFEVLVALRAVSPIAAQALKRSIEHKLYCLYRLNLTCGCNAAETRDL